MVGIGEAFSHKFRKIGTLSMAHTRKMTPYVREKQKLKTAWTDYRKEPAWNKSRKTVSVRSLMGEGREMLRDNPTND